MQLEFHSSAGNGSGISRWALVGSKREHPRPSDSHRVYSVIMEFCQRKSIALTVKDLVEMLTHSPVMEPYH